MSTPNPFAPVELAVLEAAVQLVSNIGTDPTQLAVKVPGSLDIFIGQIKLALPSLATAELATLEGDATAKLQALIASLKAPAPPAT